MKRFIDYLAGCLTGILVGVLMVGALAPTAWDVLPTPRPSPQADSGRGPEKTTERVSPLPSPDYAARTGPPVTLPAPATGPSPTPTGTRPAATATPRAATPSRLTGTATWFRSPAGVSAAGPALRAAVGPGWRGTRVTVCGAVSGNCVRTVLGDWMRADRLIDLHAPVFVAACGALSKGVCRVSVRW